MKREHIGNIIAIVFALIILAAAWITSSPFFWPTLGAVIVAPVIAVLITRWIQQFRDERFTANYNRSSRNAFIFLIFTIPSTISIHALGILTVELILALVFVVWAISIVIFYVSAIYYYKKQRGYNYEQNGS
ncbi:MAG: hypothetical protein ACTSV2_04910 [Candidatus Thorarchaeota archaeon]